MANLLEMITGKYQVTGQKKVNVKNYSGRNITLTDNGNGASIYNIDMKQYKYPNNLPKVLNIVDNSKKGVQDTLNVTLFAGQSLVKGKKDGEYFIKDILKGKTLTTLNLKGVENVTSSHLRSLVTPSNEKNPSDTILGWAKSYLSSVERGHYQQDKTPNDLSHMPDNIKNKMKEVKTKDGKIPTVNVDGKNIEVEGWITKNPDPNKKWVILFHPNKDTLEGHPDSPKAKELLDKYGYVQGTFTKESIEFFESQGYNVFAPEYRGYGARPFKTPDGKNVDPNAEVTRDGLVDDGRAAVAYLESLGVKTKNMVLFGTSIGGSVAMNTPQKGENKEYAGVISSSGYPDSNLLGQYILSNIVAKEKKAPLLSTLIVNNAHPQSFNITPSRAWDNVEALKALKENGIPTTVIESDDDTEQPDYLARLLEEAAQKMHYDKFSYVSVHKGGHFGLFEFEDKKKAVIDALKKFGGVQANK